jgi:hypothetical protein
VLYGNDHVTAESEPIQLPFTSHGTGNNRRRLRDPIDEYLINGKCINRPFQKWSYHHLTPFMCGDTVRNQSVPQIC